MWVTGSTDILHDGNKIYLKLSGSSTVYMIQQWHNISALCKKEVMQQPKEPINSLLSDTSITKSFRTSYRGFSSIDQEMERQIAMQWFSGSKQTQYSYKNFLYTGRTKG